MFKRLPFALFVLALLGVSESAFSQFSYEANWFPSLSDTLLADMDGDGKDDKVFISSYTWDKSIISTKEKDLLTHFENGYPAFYINDINKDDQPDILIGSDNGAYLYLNFNGTFAPAIKVASIYNVGRVSSADIDLDGKIDILIGAIGTSELTWHQNLGQNKFGDAQLIGTAFSSSSEIHVADLDKDGLPDVATNSPFGNSGIIWYPNQGDGQFNTTVYNTVTTSNQSFVLMDVNEDGTQDFVTVSDGIFLNDGNGNFSGIASTGFSVDLDQDGDLDSLSSNGTWYENVNGQLANSGIPTIKSNDKVFKIKDMDNDGALDILTNTGWYKNNICSYYTSSKDNDTFLCQGQAITFSVETVGGDVVSYQWNKDGQPISGATNASLTIDNGMPSDDGIYHLTINRGCSTTETKADTIAFVPDTSSFSCPETIVAGISSGYIQYAEDKDGDNDIDVLIREGSSFKWYTNDGNGNFSYEKTVRTIVSGNLLDLDKDGDIDVVNKNGNDIFFYENNGDYDYGDRTNFGNADWQNYFSDLFFVDINKDGYLDVVAATLAYSNNKIIYYQNWTGITGQLGFSEVNIASASHIYDMNVVDLDQDGDFDIVYYTDNSTNMDALVWYENDGSGNFSEAISIAETVNYGGNLDYIVDVDNDGDLDIHYTDFEYYENDGNQNFTHKLESVKIDKTKPILGTVDMDGDGDLDKFNSTYFGWSENNGANNFKFSSYISPFEAQYSKAFDIDGDGDGDVMGFYRGNLVWYENLMPAKNCTTQYDTLAQTICEGETFILGSQNITKAGEYLESFQGQNGCDSVVVLTLEVMPSSSSTVNVELCEGEQYEFGNEVFVESGEYEFTLVNKMGCDSIVTLKLNFLPASGKTINAEICAGDSYTLGEDTFTSSDTYTVIYQSAKGCDSTVTLNLTVLEEITSSSSAQICQGGTYTFGTQILDSEGTYTETFTSAKGCDSTLTLELFVVNSIQESASMTICSGQEYTFGSQNLTESGAYNETFTSVNGCDSIVTLELTVLPSIEISVMDTICADETYSFNNNTLDQSGVYTEVFVSEQGCDSTVILELTVLEEGGDACNDGKITSTEGEIESNITLYPVPTNGELHIESDFNIESIRVYNMLGVEIASRQNANSIDLSAFPQGNYLIELEANGRKERRMITKE